MQDMYFIGRVVRKRMTSIRRLEANTTR